MNFLNFENGQVISVLVYEAGSRIQFPTLIIIIFCIFFFIEWYQIHFLKPQDVENWIFWVRHPSPFLTLCNTQSTNQAEILNLSL